MNPTTQSLIRHILTALGFVLGLVGLNKFTGVLDIITQNLDGLMAAISTVSGIVISVVGFFRGKASKSVGVVLFLFSSNFLFAAQLPPVPPSGYPVDPTTGYHRSGFAVFYSLSCADIHKDCLYLIE